MSGRGGVPRLRLRLAASAIAVMALVFAALASSWIGIGIEERVRERLGEASALQAELTAVRVAVHEMATHQAHFAVDALRGAAAGEDNPSRRAFRRVHGEVRERLALIQEEQLPESERVLLVSARRGAERIGRIDAEVAGILASSDPATRAQGAELVVATAVLQVGSLADVIDSLAARAASRAEAEAEDAALAARRARILLIVFGGASLLLALVLARLLADSMARREELAARMAELARTDALTGLANRRVWDEELARGLDRAVRTGRHCTVGLLDLDHFKQYNDAHGHPQGDELLRRFAGVMREKLRVGDVLARYGGEEFAVLLHGCTAEAAVALLDRMREAMPFGQTFSAGVVESDGREPGAGLVARADEALYRAKAAGRNRTLAAVVPVRAAAAA